MDNAQEATELIVTFTSKGTIRDSAVYWQRASAKCLRAHVQDRTGRSSAIIDRKGGAIDSNPLLPQHNTETASAGG